MDSAWRNCHSHRPRTARLHCQELGGQAGCQELGGQAGGTVGIGHGPLVWPASNQRGLRGGGRQDLERRAETPHCSLGRCEGPTLFSEWPCPAPYPRSVLALLSSGEHTGASWGRASGPAHLHTRVSRSPSLLGGFGSEMSGFESSRAACPVQRDRLERLSPIYKMGVRPPFRAVWGANGPSWELLSRSPQAHRQS